MGECSLNCEARRGWWRKVRNQQVTIAGTVWTVIEYIAWLDDHIEDLSSPQKKLTKGGLVYQKKTTQWKQDNPDDGKDKHASVE